MSVVSQSARGRGQFNDPELDLSALGTTLWRKRWKILRPTILVGLVTLLAVQVITPRYQSESRVIVEVARQYLSAPGSRQGLDRSQYRRPGVGDEPGAAHPVARPRQRT